MAKAEAKIKAYEGSFVEDIQPTFNLKGPADKSKYVKQYVDIHQF